MEFGGSMYSDAVKTVPAANTVNYGRNRAKITNLQVTLVRGGNQTDY